jgi:hypothetical protein
MLFAISLVNLLFILHEWYCDRRLLRKGIETTGKITDAATYPDIENVNSGQYRFYAEFIVNDITYHASSRFVSGLKNGFLGKEVPILYDPDDPEKSRFKNDISIMRKEAGFIVMLFAGICLVIYGAFF